MYSSLESLLNALRSYTMVLCCSASLWRYRLLHAL